jgi:hypothetical protein
MKLYVHKYMVLVFNLSRGHNKLHKYHYIRNPRFCVWIYYFWDRNRKWEKKRV